MPPKKLAPQETAAILFFAALLFGAALRLEPAIVSGFPLNDGGMFYVMIQGLKANQYALPAFSSYNAAQIPFAYPPLGFYAAALLSDAFSISEIQILRWLPALVNILSMFAFYKFAEALLGSRINAALATLAYALSPRSFLWQVMGGGITRAFGMFFMLLMFWQARQLFETYSRKRLALAILFGAGAALSHPQTALHAALGGVMLFAFYGRSKRGILSALETGVGVALLILPWALTVGSRHGLETFLSAAQTSPQAWSFLNFRSPADYLALPFLFFFCVGLWQSIQKRDFFFIVWIALAYLIDSRGAGSAAFIAESLLAGAGLFRAAAWVSRIRVERENAVILHRASLTLILVSAFLFLLSGAAGDFQLLNTRLEADDLKTIEWVNTRTPKDSVFLLVTGREFSMSDPMQEWFPALTERRSATTLQGLEWTLGERFFPWHEQLVAFQRCADIACVAAWSKLNGVDADYLIVTIPSATETGGLADSRRSLIASARSLALSPLYESERALIFER